MIFIFMKLNPWVSSVAFPSIPPWEKSSFVFSMARIKATAQSLRSILWSPHDLDMQLLKAT